MTMTSTITYAPPRQAQAGAPFPGDLAHLTSAGDVTREQAQWLFTRAEWMARQPAGHLRGILSGRLLGSLFYQNSTRTRLSFEAAMHRLGGSVIGFDDVRTTRAGDFFAESLPDTVRVVGQYVDCIALRHTADGAASDAAGLSPVPVINAGDGANEHPTQALLDVGLLHRLLGDLTGTRIGLVGDPGCRDFRSLVRLLPLFGVAEAVFLPAPATGVGPAERQALRRGNVAWSQVGDVTDLLKACDAICMLPVDLPTFHVGTAEPPRQRKPLPNCYRLSRHKLLGAPRQVPVLHVGPRGEELPPAVDDLPCVHYFEQARYGLYLRAALLEVLITGAGAPGAPAARP